MNRTHLIIPCTAQKAKISEECLEISQVKSDKMDQTIEHG
ncbi:hypothetical protein JCM19239_6803 [Vibrio variabilis]|uniref:Uncharacterized protein n=1 Tax=Vibrio variabilis TaxID=990271 RepID=A0ABQ0JPA9_9VIBR|nr:hypothetical protein JCM19239_6803 [Vibrio variabilis]